MNDQRTMNHEDPREEEQVYFPAILRILGWSKTKYYSFNPQTGMRWCDELRGTGVVVEQWERHRGADGKLKRSQRYLKAFPWKLRNWIQLKGAKGQRV